MNIGEIARRSGVSRSTVSYVLSGNRSISAGTIAKVERSIEELQFRPHAGARSIRTRRTGVIAMALPLVHGPHNQVQILPYNRVVKDLGGLSADAFLAAVRDRFPARRILPHRECHKRDRGFASVQIRLCALAIFVDHMAGGKTVQS